MAALLFLHSSRFNYVPKVKSESDSAIWPSSRELRRQLRQAAKFLFIYSEGDAAVYTKSMEELSAKLRWLQIEIRSEAQITNEQLHSFPLLLAGKNFSNENVAKLIAALPTCLTEDVTATRDSDVYTLSGYPNPLNLNLPVVLVTGSSATEIANQIRASGYQLLRPGEFRVVRNGRTMRLGFFEQKEKGLPWTMDASLTRNYLATEKDLAETPHYRFLFNGSSPPKDLPALFSRLERRFVSTFAAFGFSAEQSDSIKKIAYYLYDSLEDKGLITGNTDLSHFDADRWAVHTVFNEEMQGADFFADARLLTATLLGPTRSSALRDGVAMLMTDGWGRHGYRYWVKRIFDAGQINPLTEVLDSNIYEKESYLFMRPLAGSFVEFLLSKYDGQTFAELYKLWPDSGLPESQLLDLDVKELEREWRAHLSNLTTSPDLPFYSQKPSRERVFHKGFCYAHEGYQIYNGYLSRESEQSLAKLRSLGTDWVSVTPFGYLDDKHKPGYFHFSSGAGAENDESVLAAFYAAKQAGMRTMLKPHVLLASRNFGWPGEVEMKNEADWHSFFKFYSRWIRHHALLAEMYQMDMFCIGVELYHATKHHQDERRQLIRDMRKIYSGPIVYAANWWQEFDHIEFWDELDYIGLNCYYPLSADATVTLEQLKGGVSGFLPGVEKVVKRFKRPLLLTEVGFTSTAQPWKEPHERRRGARVNLADQALAYRAIFESFWGKEWFAGFYWWKWPTYLDYGGADHNGFTPNGKPAEKVVSEWFSKETSNRASTP